MPEMRNGLPGHAAAARGPSCGRITPRGEKSISHRGSGCGEDKVAVVADDDVEIEAGDETFLEEEEEDADDVGDLIDDEIGDEEER